MSIHVAILKPVYLERILSGSKKVESRFYKTRQPPVGQIREGERLFLKQSAGRYLATAVAGRVVEHEQLTPATVDRLREEHGAEIGGDAAYWQAKRGSRYAVLIPLTAVEPLEVGPTYPPNPWRGWHVLDERLSPLREVSLTAGAIRNRYLRLPGANPRLERGPITLLLPDGREQTTSLRRGMIRWRGWGPYFDRHRLAPGDRVRLIAEGEARFRVLLPKAPQS